MTWSNGSRLALLSLFLLVGLVQADSLYERSDVIDLNPTTFKSRVQDSDEVWLVEFYAPWCGHCKSLVPDYLKVAKALKGVVKVGAVNADEHRSLGSQFGVKGFPTIKLFGVNKKQPSDHAGARTARALIDASLAEVKRLVNVRLDGKSGSSSSSSSSGGSSKDVVELTDDNFARQVLKSQDVWLVEFYAPWCGHCQRLAPVWAEVATELKGKVKIGALDATVHNVIANEHSIKGFPTIKAFIGGQAQEYDGGRTKEDFVRFALEKLAENAKAPELVQLTSGDNVKQVCDDNQLCVISFLPHILDCDAKCRNTYLDTLKQISEQFKRNQWGYLWAEAVQQPQLEEALGVGGFGYPALAVLNTRKMKYSLLRGSFGFDGIKEFLRDLSYGKGSSFAIRGDSLPQINKIDAWDGKDGELPSIDDDDTSHVEL
jgi:protein disulfide-isomerase A6